MKHLLLTIFIIIFLSVLPVFSQNISEWMRIETEDKKLSFAFPTTNVIDAEKRDHGQRLKIVAFENGVEFNIDHIKENGAKDRIRRTQNFGKIKSEIFKVGDFLIQKTD
jgi:hypothetical protein